MWSWAYWNSLGSSRVILRISAPWSPETVGADHWAEWFSLMVSTVHRHTKPYQKPSPSLSWLSTRMARQKVSISRKGGSWFEKWCIYWSNIHVSLPSVKFLSPSSKITAGLHWSQNLLLCALSYHTHTHLLKLCPQRHPSVFLWVTCSDKSYHMLKKISVEYSS